MSQNKKVWEHKDRPGIYFNGNYVFSNSHTYWVGKKFQLVALKGKSKKSKVFDSWQHARREGWVSVDYK